MCSDWTPTSFRISSALDSKGLIGGDLLGLHAFTIDLERGALGFGKPVPSRHASQIRIRLASRVPLTTIEIDGSPTDACIDTAKLSYLDQVSPRTRGGQVDRLVRRHGRDAIVLSDTQTEPEGAMSSTEVLGHEVIDKPSVGRST